MTGNKASINIDGKQIKVDGIIKRYGSSLVKEFVGDKTHNQRLTTNALKEQRVLSEGINFAWENDLLGDQNVMDMQLYELAIPLLEAHRMAYSSYTMQAVAFGQIITTLMLSIMDGEITHDVLLRVPYIEELEGAKPEQYQDLSSLDPVQQRAEYIDALVGNDQLARSTAYTLNYSDNEVKPVISGSAYLKDLYSNLFEIELLNSKDLIIANLDAINDAMINMQILEFKADVLEKYFKVKGLAEVLAIPGLKDNVQSHCINTVNHSINAIMNSASIYRLSAPNSKNETPSEAGEIYINKIKNSISEWLHPIDQLDPVPEKIVKSTAKKLVAKDLLTIEIFNAFINHQLADNGYNHG